MNFSKEEFLQLFILARAIGCRSTGAMGIETVINEALKAWSMIEMNTQNDETRVR